MTPQLRLLPRWPLTPQLRRATCPVVDVVFFFVIILRRRRLTASFTSATSGLCFLATPARRLGV